MLDAMGPLPNPAQVVLYALSFDLQSRDLAGQFHTNSWASCKSCLQQGELIHLQLEAVGTCKVTQERMFPTKFLVGFTTLKVLESPLCHRFTDVVSSTETRILKIIKLFFSRSINKFILGFISLNCRSSFLFIKETGRFKQCI